MLELNIGKLLHGLNMAKFKVVIQVYNYQIMNVHLSNYVEVNAKTWFKSVLNIIVMDYVPNVSQAMLFGEDSVELRNSVYKILIIVVIVKNVLRIMLDNLAFAFRIQF